ncbi:MAG: NUDIX domain-containing protein [Candidatus Kariarchaeaceae archaeon]
MLDKHFTATTYLLDKQTKSTLLHWHKKIKTWLPPGGHIEKNETPEEAARREIEEETGITDLVFIPNQDDSSGIIDERSKLLLLPHYILEEEIELNHYHLDWIYFAFIERGGKEITYNNTVFKWFDINKLELETTIFENVKYLAKKAIQNFCNP